MPRLHVAFASYAAAKHACTNWHYSGTVPAGKLVIVGVWESETFIGVVLFGRGANNNLSKAYGLEQTEACELVRIALTDHATPVSRIVRVALALLRKENARLQLVISYADPEQGHHGGIYQAGNWVYSGESAKALKVKVAGEWMHKRSYDSLAVKPEIEGQRWADPKHIYLMPLTKDMRRKIASLEKPYPKRNKQAMAATSGTAAGQHRPLRSNVDLAP